MKLNRSNYQSYVDSAYRYFLEDRTGVKLDQMLDIIDDYDNTPAVDYYRISNDDFETYRLKRKLIRGLESGVSKKSIDDIIDGEEN